MSQKTKIMKVIKVIVIVFITTVVALSCCLFATFDIIWDFLSRETTVMQSPSGLGETRFTKTGFGRDGFSTLIVEARKSGDWFWKHVGRFNIPRQYSREFQEACWTSDGAVLLITTHYKGGGGSMSHLAEDGKTYIHKEYPEWERNAVTHVFDFRSGRTIAPESITPEAIDAASTQIKAIMGERTALPPFPDF